MIERSRYALAAALLLSPLAAHAQPAPAPGPDGRQRIVVRDIERGPGGGMGPGMGMRRGWPGGPMARRGGGMAMRLRLAQLDLSDAQRAKLRDLHEAHARKAIQRRADMQLARLDLHRLMSADRPDPGAVNAQIDKLARLHADGLKAAFDMRMQARAVLTPEQLKQLRAPLAPRMTEREMLDTPDGRPKR